MPLVITLSASLGNDLSTDQKMYLIMIILGVISWPGMARLVRAQILIEREKDFVLAARALGIKEGSIIVRHILPNVMNICIVNMTLSYADKMLMEAALSLSLIHILQEAQDYYLPPITGSYLRLIRIMVFFLTLFVTPIWYYLNCNPDFAPDWFQFALIQDNMNLPIILQLLMLELGIDALKPVSYTHLVKPPY